MTQPYVMRHVDIPEENNVVKDDVTYGAPKTGTQKNGNFSSSNATHNFSGDKVGAQSHLPDHLPPDSIIGGDPTAPFSSRLHSSDSPPDKKLLPLAKGDEPERPPKPPSPTQVYEQVVPRPPPKNPSLDRQDSEKKNRTKENSPKSSPRDKGSQRQKSNPSAPPMTDCSKCEDTFYDTNFKLPYVVKTDDAVDVCKVRVVIPGLKKPSWFGWCGRNANVDVQFEEQSLRVIVELFPSKAAAQKHAAGKTEKPPDKYLFKVKKLPDYIEPYQSTYKIKENQLELVLKKMVPRSWYAEIQANGLETADDAASLDEQYNG